MIFIILSSLCVAVDASCCNVVNGLEIKKINKYTFITSILFALFQGIMLFLGFQFTYLFKEDIFKISTLLAFGLLFYLSISMIISSFKKEERNEISLKNIIIQAIATSIDASALGITFRVMNIDIIVGVVLVVIITLILSFIAFILGIKIGDKVNKHMKLVGGIVLLIIALKILLF